MMKMVYRISVMALLVALSGSPALAADGQASSIGMPPPGYGPGMMSGMTPDQRQQHWEQMRRQGYSPGMGRGMNPEPTPQGPGAQ